MTHEERETLEAVAFAIQNALTTDEAKPVSHKVGYGETINDRSITLKMRNGDLVTATYIQVKSSGLPASDKRVT
jgi:hypothetical protein